MQPSQRSLVWICSFALVLALTTAPAAFAQPPWDVDFPAEPEPSDDIGSIFSTANYSCNINISPFSSEDCSLEDVVDPQPSPFGSNQRRAIVDLNQGFNWRSLVVRVETCNPTGWTVHIGDSPTNNGYGGDSGSTSHDAEVQALNNQLTVYESDIGTSSLTCLFTGPPNPPGCIVQQYLVRNDYFEFDPNVPLTTNPLSICSNSTIFDFPNYDEADLEDPSGLYEDKVYVGLNRTYGSSSRNGSGIQRACFFLSTSATPNNSTITSECGF